VNDRHLRILRAAAKRERDRARLEREADHDDGTAGASRRRDVERASEVADARLAAAEARRRRTR
jgi:hypothetical protein